MNQNIAIIGGDLRIVKLAKILAKDGYVVNTYALENAEELKNIENINFSDKIEEAVNNVYNIISSIPLSKDNKEIYAPYSKEKIGIDEIANKIKRKKLIAGAIKREALEIFQNKNVEIIDLLKYEELTILNTISTAEGALQIAMEETDKTIYNSNVLILGFGRVGKTTALKFDKIGAKVYCEARKIEDLAWIKTYGYTAIELNELNKYLNKFDIIINTIPSMIIGENEIKKIKKECIIIDLASFPGGVDFEKANEYKIKAILALGLPGKVAPETSAEFIKETLYKLL